jgi:hypothetical protein
LEGAVSLYSISVFLHIVGALGLFAGLALEQASLVNLRRASSVAQAREWASVLGSRRRVEGPSALVLVATGLYLMSTRWGHQPWIGLGLLGLVLIAVLGIALTGRRAKALARAIPAGDGALPASFARRLDDPVLRVSASLRIALALGIVFDMSAKPGTLGALAAMGVALALGGAVALSGWGSARGAVESIAERG